MDPESVRFRFRFFLFRFSFGHRGQVNRWCPTLITRMKTITNDPDIDFITGLNTGLNGCPAKRDTCHLLIAGVQNLNMSEKSESESEGNITHP